VRTLALQLLCVVMMLAVGLELTPTKLARVRHQAQPLGLALFANLVVVPLVCLAVALAIGAPPAVTTGIVLCGAAPGGASGPLFASVARTDVPFAVALMVVLSALSVFTAPLTLGLLLAGAKVDAGALVWPMMQMLMLLQLAPLAVGIAIHAAHPVFAVQLARPVSQFANGLLLLIILGLLIGEGGALGDVGFLTVVACIGLVAMNLGLGVVVSPVPATRWAASFATAVRNLTLALLVATTWFPDPMTNAAVLTYGLFTIAIPFGVSWVLYRRPLPEE